MEVQVTIKSSTTANKKSNAHVVSGRLFIALVFFKQIFSVLSPYNYK